MNAGCKPIEAGASVARLVCKAVLFCGDFYWNGALMATFPSFSLFGFYSFTSVLFVSSFLSFFSLFSLYFLCFQITFVECGMD